MIFFLGQQNVIFLLLDRLFSMLQLVLIKDALLMIKRREKAQHQAGFKPTTSGSRGVCSTTGLQPLPKLGTSCSTCISGRINARRKIQIVSNFRISMFSPTCRVHLEPKKSIKNLRKVDNNRFDF